LENEAGLIYRENMTAGDDPIRRQPDITKAMQLLEWKPKINLETGIKKIIPYFKSRMGLL